MLTLFFAAAWCLGYSTSPHSIKTSETEAISQAASKKVRSFDGLANSSPPFGDAEGCVFSSTCSVLSWGEELWELAAQTSVSILISYLVAKLCQVSLLPSGRQDTPPPPPLFWAAPGKVGALELWTNL